MNWKEFVKAGKAIFTVENETSGNRFTYKIKRCGNKDVWFVSVLNGPDNYHNYRYIGTIFGKDFRRTKKSVVGPEALSFRAFVWLNKILNSDSDLPEFVKVYHEGRCGRCGKRLTVPESIKSGFGPCCIKLI